MRFKATKEFDRLFDGESKIDVKITRVDVKTLENPRKVISNIGSVEICNLGIKGVIGVTVVISNSSIKKGFMLGSVEIYGKANNGEEELLFVSEGETEMYFHSKDEGKYEYRLRFDIDVKDFSITFSIS